MADFLGLMGCRGGEVTSGGVARIPTRSLMRNRLQLPHALEKLTSLTDIVVFGIEMWPAAEYGRTMYTIRQRVRPILMRTEKRYVVLILCLSYAKLNFVFIDVCLLFVATIALQWKEISAFGVTNGDFSHDSFVFKQNMEELCTPFGKEFRPMFMRMEKIYVAMDYSSKGWQHLVIDEGLITNNSVVFGIEMWPAAEYGRTMYTIRQRVRPILMRTEKRYVGRKVSGVGVARISNMVKEDVNYYAKLNFVFIDVCLLFVATIALQWKEISAFGVTNGDFSHDSFVFKISHEKPVTAPSCT
ncbi:hypothetical protein Tco_0259987 [Tanacetum coccineum]